MRAPILNDRGQFRFTDFVGYLPDFLKSEPDVVTLMQVFSDYINNAYRNIETIEKFEFKLVAREDRVDAITKKLDNLRSMFELAANRNDTACLLSVPRANVKSNVTFGKSTGKSAYTVNYTGESVVDTIRPATNVDAGIANFDDGDVVYVNYVALKDGEEIHPYYYDATSNSLIAEPCGTSQDPFTGTPNQPGRIITFKVSDVSSVKQRFGSLVDGNKYFEVFFTARIQNVTSADSVVTIKYDVDLQDGTDDAIVIDYYDSEYVASTDSEKKFHTYVRFFKRSGWAWNDGYPTCIFYMRDSTGAKLTSTQTTDSTIAPMESCTDPSATNEPNKYAVKSYTMNNDNSMTVELESYCPMYDSTSMYLLNRKTGDVLGEYTLVSRQAMSGSIVADLMPTTHVDKQKILNAEKLSLVEIPLFYNRGVLNYDKAKATIKWTSHIPLIGSTNVVFTENTSAKACTGSGITDLGAFTLTRSQITGGAEIELPKNVIASLTSARDAAGYTTVCGMKLYCENAYWSGIATVMTDPVATIDGYKITLSASTPIAAGTSEVAELYLVNSAYITVVNGEVTGYWNDTVVTNGSYVILNGTKTLLAKVSSVSDEVFTFDTIPSDGTYLVTVLKVDDEIGVSGFINVDTNDEYQTGTCKRYRGNVFSAEYMIASDEYGSTELLHCLNDVVEADGNASRLYKVGEYAYDTSTGKVYVCMHSTTLEVGQYPSSSQYFRLDRIAHFYVPYRTTTNAFMPYYGSFTTLEYGEGVNYTKSIDLVTEPLYIEKVDEHALKYGWEHREFLNYKDYINLNKRDRSGFVEFFSTAKSGDADCMETNRDIVDSSLASRASWGFTYPVVKNGKTSTLKVDIDNPISVSAERVASGSDTVPDRWKVTVNSAAHGLVEGCRIMVSGLSDATVKTASGTAVLNLNTSRNDDAINEAEGYATVSIIDGDTFSYTVPGSDKILSDGPVSALVENAVITYSRDLIYRVITEPAYLEEKSAADPDHDYYNLSIESLSVGLSNGTEVQLLGFTGLNKVKYTVSNDDNENNQTVTVALDKGETIACDLYPRIVRSIEDDDVKYVLVDGEVYEISNGDWIYHEKYDIPEPSTLYCKANLFDCTLTNYPYAIGDAREITHIEYIGNNRAIIRLFKPIESFTADNAYILNSRARVYITNVYPSDYCGWHLVTKVYNPYTIEIAMQLKDDKLNTGVAITGTTMNCYEGRWYKYSINEIDWDKRSNCVTYSVKNLLAAREEDDDDETDRYQTKYVHNFAVGDYAIIAPVEQFYSLDSTYDQSDAEWTQVKITKVTSDRGIEFKKIFAWKNGKESTDIPEYCDGNHAIVKGIVLTTIADNLTILKNCYSTRIQSIGNEMYRFDKGCVVVALGQVNTDEIGTYLVEENMDWALLRRKRIMKISGMSIDKYQNPEYEAGAADDGLDEYKYTTYSDVDVYNDTESYVCTMQHTRNGHFNRPSLENMDTTRNPNAEYSSAEDFSTVAPRYDMKKSFKGVPDMTYPLVEKIERLAYLRDADVIDFDLIGYLARFMGYDITSASDDISTSNIYRTISQQEKAIRETVANLPQYYSLGGTEAGLKMLISTFGVISDVLTLYTNTTDPYGELLTKDEVDERVMKEEKNGSIVGSWVPTPYISIEITDDSRFPQFALQQSDVPRIKEQIRVWKPINVVFKDFILKYTGEIGVTASISGVTTGGTVNGGVACVDCKSGTQLDTLDSFEIQYSDDEELTNCAF